MATVVLSAASPDLPALQTLSTLLAGALREAGETDIRTFDLASTKLAYCQGEFDCWVKTPGICRAHDAEEDIVHAIHDAAHVVLLDRVTFGGHSYTLKRAQDRFICLLSPFFEKRASLTHHVHMATAPMPDALYRLLGDFGWRYMAYKNGLSQAALHARPLD